MHRSPHHEERLVQTLEGIMETILKRAYVLIVEHVQNLESFPLVLSHGKDW